MFKLKTDNKILKKYNEDLWGSIRLNMSINNASFYFIAVKSTGWVSFSMIQGISSPIKKRKRRSDFYNLLSLRKKLCYFYGGFSKRHFRFLGKNAKILKGDFTTNLVTLLEKSLAFCVYRMNFSQTIGQAIELVLGGFILVNKEVVRRARYTVAYGDVVEVARNCKKQLFANYVERLAAGMIIQLESDFAVVSYTNMAGLVYKAIPVEKVLYPFDVKDTFFVSDFFGKL